MGSDRGVMGSGSWGRVMGSGSWGQTEFQVNLKLGLTPHRPRPLTDPSQRTPHNGPLTTLHRPEPLHPPRVEGVLGIGVAVPLSDDLLPDQQVVARAVNERQQTRPNRFR